MSGTPLSDKDVNTSMSVNDKTHEVEKPGVKSMEYHRQVLASKMEEEKTKTYISPSDNIMSPCTAKLNAYRNKQVGKAKPKSLFAQASSRKLAGSNDGGLFGSSKSVPKTAAPQEA